MGKSLVITFLGYTCVRANSATDVPAFSANCGSGQYAYNEVIPANPDQPMRL